MKQILFLLAVLFLLSYHTNSSAQNRNINELLGYPADTKLLIIHADDIGLSHSVNTAVIKAFEDHAITSGSIMVPCPWFGQFAEYARLHPGLDVGIHCTLNAEWKFYKFGGVSPACDIPTLLDQNGYFPPDIPTVLAKADPAEFEKELRAQINRAIYAGICPTHLDSHMGTMYYNPALFRIVLKVAAEYKLPVSLPYNLLDMVPSLKNELTPNLIGVDNFLMLQSEALGGNWPVMYEQMVKALKPGLNEMVVHLALDNDEMSAITTDHDDYGSAWRQNDLNVVMSAEFKQLLKNQHVQLVTWKQIQEAAFR